MLIKYFFVDMCAKSEINERTILLLLLNIITALQKS